MLIFLKTNQQGQTLQSTFETNFKHNIYFYLFESNQGEEIKLKVISSIRVHLVRHNNTPQQKQSQHFSKLPLSSLCLELLIRIDIRIAQTRFCMHSIASDRIAKSVNKQ